MITDKRPIDSDLATKIIEEYDTFMTCLEVSFQSVVALIEQSKDVPSKIKHFNTIRDMVKDQDRKHDLITMIYEQIEPNYFQESIYSSYLLTYDVNMDKVNELLQNYVSVFDKLTTNEQILNFKLMTSLVNEVEKLFYTTQLMLLHHV